MTWNMLLKKEKTLWSTLAGGVSALQPDKVDCDKRSGLYGIGTEIVR
jgi:hypothetical protein